jgi:hypothetical protein
MKVDMEDRVRLLEDKVEFLAKEVCRIGKLTQCVSLGHQWHILRIDQHENGMYIAGVRYTHVLRMECDRCSKTHSKGLTPDQYNTLLELELEGK